MSIVLKEGANAGEYIVSEDVHLSREQGVVAAGNILPAGTVLGKRDADGKYVPFNPTGGDGSAQFAGICYDNVDASEEDQPVVVTARLAAVKKDALIWPEGMTQDEVTAAANELALKFIVLR